MVWFPVCLFLHPRSPTVCPWKVTGLQKGNFHLPVPSFCQGTILVSGRLYQHINWLSRFFPEKKQFVALKHEFLPGSTPQKLNINTLTWPYFKPESPFPRPIILGIHVSFRGCKFLSFSAFAVWRDLWCFGFPRPPGCNLWEHLGLSPSSSAEIRPWSVAGVALKVFRSPF